MQSKRILCAVDFSEGSACAVAKASEFARRLDEPIELIHVYPLPMLPLFEGNALFENSELEASTMDLLSDGASEKLEQIRANLVAQGLRCTTRLLGGDAATQLIACSEQPETEMLVLGSHGRMGLRRLAMGSVAARVLRRATAPVLTVHAAPAS
jgi:nucleotide-binding universal stress UspA family protein